MFGASTRVTYTLLTYVVGGERQKKSNYKYLSKCPNSPSWWLGCLVSLVSPCLIVVLSSLFWIWTSIWMLHIFCRDSFQRWRSGGTHRHAFISRKQNIHC